MRLPPTIIATKTNGQLVAPVWNMCPAIQLLINVREQERSPMNTRLHVVYSRKTPIGVRHLQLMNKGKVSQTACILQHFRGWNVWFVDRYVHLMPHVFVCAVQRTGMFRSPFISSRRQNHVSVCRPVWIHQENEMKQRSRGLPVQARKDGTT